jgi:hypothetical protein
MKIVRVHQGEMSTNITPAQYAFSNLCHTAKAWKKIECMRQPLVVQVCISAGDTIIT